MGGICSGFLAVASGYAVGKYHITVSASQQSREVVVPRRTSRGDTIGTASVSDADAPVAIDVNSILDTMPLIEYGSCNLRVGENESEDGGQNLCPLCLSVFQTDTQVRVTPCRHVFCGVCL